MKHLMTEDELHVRNMTYRAWGLMVFGLLLTPVLIGIPILIWGISELRKLRSV